MRPIQNSLFRDNIIHALDNTSSDEELKKELRKLIDKEINKEIPYIMRPIKQVNKTVH